MLNRTGQTQTSSRWTLSMRLTVTLVAVALIAITVVSLGTLNERYTRKTLTEEVQHRLLVEARSLASSASATLLDDYPELTLQPVINEITRDRDELAFAVIVDHEGQIQGHRDSRRLGTAFALPSDLVESRGLEYLHAAEQLYTNRDLILAIAPSIHENEQQVGSAILAVHRDYLEQRLASARDLQLLVVLVMLVVGSLLALLVMGRLLQPIRDLIAGLERIGRGDMDTPVSIQQTTELGVLAEHINAMAADLKHAQAEMMQRERLSHEMELAREIQESLLPEDEQRFGQFSILGSQTAASEVGGDFYDVFTLPDHRVGLVVADVAGKGLAGCLATSMLAAFLRAYCGVYTSPADLFDKLDQELGRVLPLGTFVTMFYAVLDPESGALTFASAGHVPMLVYRASTGATEWQDSTGVPLASVRRSRRRPAWKEKSIQLYSGDLMLQFTDGVNEAWSVSGDEQFGFDRVASTLEQFGRQGGQKALQGLRSAVAKWSGGNACSDDETLLVVSYENEDPNQSVNKIEEPECEADFHALLERARQEGSYLQVPAELEALVILKDWLTTREGLNNLNRNETGILTTAIYEYCANIVEHGYKGDGEGPLEIFWLPGGEPEELGGNPAFYDDNIRHAASVLRGCFLIRDTGKPYDPSVWQPLDFEDPATRRRGRGMGLQIIHTSMWKVLYLPSRSEGNITYLKYNPVKHWHATEVPHV